MAFFARFRLATLALMVVVPPATGQEPAAGVATPEPEWSHLASGWDCFPGPDSMGVDLAGFWERAEAVDPAFQRFHEWAQAERAAAAAIRREWLPAASLQGVGDYGQRLSPGEERALGVGARGELRALAQWRILDGDRGARSATATHREGVVRAEEDVFRADVREELAGLYLETRTARKRVELREGQVERLDELGGYVEERARAGFESTWEEGLLNEARTRAHRHLVEARGELELAESQMALHMGSCWAEAGGATAPEPSHQDRATGPALPSATGSAAPSDAGEAGTAPEVALGLRRAEALNFLAREEARRDRWSLDVLGIVGPNRSRAFDDGFIRHEYLVGLALSWRPDLAGIRDRLAEVERARARAERAWAQGIQAEVDRELVRLELDEALQEEVGRHLRTEMAAASARLDGALLRWTEGVDRWIDVLQAAERLTEVEAEALHQHLAVAELMVRQHRLRGTMERLPEALSLHSRTWSR
ncbi:MAG: TolC family protein [Gemmatimonadales bacterium]|nr:MAG: TolC family protein [Gemmatimonadales bacterium]